MSISSRPTSPTTSLAKSFRFSSSQGAPQGMNSSSSITTFEENPTNDNTSLYGHGSSKRLSMLPNLLTRSRTSSLPPPRRPHTSSGALKPEYNAQPAGMERVDLDASASQISFTDPFGTDPTSMGNSSGAYQPSRPPSQHSTLKPQSTHGLFSLRSRPDSPPTSPSSGRRRNSLLGTAGSLPSFSSLSSFTRKKPRIPALNLKPTSSTAGTLAGLSATPQRIVLTEVIEISESAVRASRRAEEEEAERQRLRDAAKKALGIGELEEEGHDVDYHGYNDLSIVSEDGILEVPHSPLSFDKSPTVPVVPSRVSTPSIPAHPHPGHSRTRSGSFLTRPSTPATLHTTPVFVSNTPVNLSSTYSSTHKSLKSLPSPQAPEIPPFPSTPSALAPFTQKAGAMCKHYPAPSLLMFALAKQWKSRFLVLTSPMPPSPATPTFFNGGSASKPEFVGQIPYPSYIHLFKSSGPDEREIERLEINEESVVFLSDDEVGGRKRVIKVAGYMKKKTSSGHLGQTSARTSSVSSSALSGRISTSSSGSVEEDYHGSSSTFSHSSTMHSEEPKTTWVLQILDSEEAQKWIGVIKNAVLSQRSIRAGLGGITPITGVEPMGDLDVMLSIRAQGLISSPVSPLSDSPIEVPSNAAKDHWGSTATALSHDAPGASDTPNSSLGRSRSAAATGYFGTSYSNSITSSSAADNHASYASAPPESLSSSSPTSRPSPSATAALKSLFTIGGGRPRSPSIVSPPSISSENHDIEVSEESFGSAGVHLMMQSGGLSGERPMTPVQNGVPGSVPHTPRAGTPVISGDLDSAPSAILERKILGVEERQRLEWVVEGIEPLGPRPGTGRVNNGTLGLGLPLEHDGIIPGRKSSDTLSSPSLPPPRRRAGTTGHVTASGSTFSSYVLSSSPSSPIPERGELIVPHPYTHANGSTAESLGVRQPPSSPNAPLPDTPVIASSPRMGERRAARGSWSSVSSMASGDHHLSSSPDDPKFRRWSRRRSLPQRLNPPNGPPPSTPPILEQPDSPGSGTRTPSHRHRFATDESNLSRSPSMNSQHSSDVHSRPFSVKRASDSSGKSITTTNSGQSRATGMSIFSHGHRSATGHRASVPPPQRPVPNFALPPTPDDQVRSSLTPTHPTPGSQSAPMVKSTLRDSLSLRGKRFSLSPPSCPPSSSLPPVPNDPRFQLPPNSHRKSSSQGSNVINALYPIPASPDLSPPLPSRDSPPAPNLTVEDELTPDSSTPTPYPQSSGLRTASALKRRLRILSSPPTSPPLIPPPMPPMTLDDSDETERPKFENNFAFPVPQTPIGERITAYQNDPNFLFMSPPSPPRSPVPAPVLTPQGLMPLSPPPRRCSRRISTPEKEKVEQEVSSLESIPDDAPSSAVGNSRADAQLEAVVPMPPEVDDLINNALRSPSSPQSFDSSHSISSSAEVGL